MAGEVLADPSTLYNKDVDDDGNDKHLARVSELLGKKAGGSEDGEGCGEWVSTKPAAPQHESIVRFASQSDCY